MSDRPVAIVTGASRGIGEATAWLLAARGWDVYATARNVESLAGLQSSRVTPVRLDLTDTESIEAALEQVLEDRGRIDGLVNNAGYAEAGPLDAYDLDTVWRQFATNAFGPLRLTQLVLAAMRAQEGGRIVNVGTVMGRMPLPLLGLYSSSKSALEAFNDVVRLETRSFGVRSIMVIPGTVRTDFDEVVLQTLLDRDLNGSPYHEAIEHFKEMSEGSTENGIPPEAVAEKIHHALTARWPRACYSMAADARLVLWFLRYLPPMARDRLLRTFLKV